MPNDTSVDEMPDTETDKEVTVGNKRKSKWSALVVNIAKCTQTTARMKVQRWGQGLNITGLLLPMRRTLSRLRSGEGGSTYHSASSRKVRPSVRAQEAREANSSGSASKKRDQGGRNGRGQASGKAR
uniref:Uncharacterized protein n=1 Tax=Moniliophthora roreri TaxID=221103 RepID=A0A0W0FC82_MONRR